MARWATARQRSIASQLLRGSLPLVLAVGLQNGSNFLFHVVVSRLLGPTSYGGLAAILAIALVVSAPLGVVQVVVAKSTSVLRSAGREPEILEAAARTAKGAALVGAAVAVLFVAAAPLLAFALHMGVGPIALLGPYILFSLLLGVPLGAMQGGLRFRAMGVVLVVGVAVRLGLGIGLAAAGWGVTGAVLASSLSQGAALASALVLLAVPRDTWRRAASSLSILRGGFAPALFGFGAYWLLVETDLVLARHFLDDRDAGLYAAAGLLARALLFLSGAVCWAALPRFSETGGRGKAARRWLRGAIGVTATLSLAGLAGLVLLRSWVVDVAFGSRFLRAAQLLPTLGVAMALLSVAGLLVYFHVAAESRAWLLLLIGVATEVGLVTFFHSSPEQIAFVLVAVSALVTFLLYHAASAILKWSPSVSPLSSYAEVGGGRTASDVELSVVIPCHNGGSGLAVLVERVARELDGLRSEIVVVSDGSTDETANVAEHAGLEGVRVLHYVRQEGKGHALRIGLAEARGQYVAFIDADGDIDPEGLRPFLSLMQLYQPDIVLGSKRHPLSEVHYPPLRRALSWTYHKFGRLLFRVNVRDTQTGLKLIRRDVLASVLPLMLEKRYAFDLELLVVARRMGFTRVFEAPVRIDYRFDSRVDPGAAFEILLDTLAIFYRRYVLNTYGSGGRAPKRHEAPDPGGRRRILFLNWRDIRNPDAGGAEVLTHEVAKQWVRQGHDVTLLTSRFPRSANVEVIDGVRVRRMGRLRIGTFHLRTQWELAHLHGYDVVIDEINTVPFFTPLWRRRLPPVVGLIHQLAVEVWDAEVPGPVATLGHWLEPRMLRLYRDVPMVTVSESTRGDLEALGLRNVCVVPQGRDDPPALNGTKKAVAPTFLFVGRLTANKRPDHALEAFRLIREELPNARLWIVGRGPMEQALRRHLPAGAEMLGFLPRDELYRRMAEAHCLLVTSVREGWGLVITEANGVGTPAVGYDVPGVRDAIVDGRTGTLASFGDRRSVARQAVAMVSDPGRYAEMRSRAIAWAEGFSWETTADRLMCVVEERVLSSQVEVPRDVSTVATAS